MKKIKILMVSDHPFSGSGVGVESRYLIDGLIKTGRYSFFCLGGALKHTDYNIIKASDDLIIKPVDGFGDKPLIMQALNEIKPDLMLLFTDPRFFEHVWQMEDMIHDFCPIAYNTIWDNYPVPHFNKRIYSSCDLLNCINEVSYNSIKEILPQYKEFGMVNYVPHAVPEDLYFPMNPAEVYQLREKAVGAQRAKDCFIGLFVSRNAMRKRPNDIMLSWKLFLDDLEKKHGHKNAVLIMHTNPFDDQGPNLEAVKESLNLQNNVIFSSNQVNFNEMRAIYNISDFLINISSAEGFGIPLLEAKMCGKPGVILKTGGLTKQIVSDEGYEFGVALEPEVKSLVGSQPVPYIYDDHISHETVKNAFMKLYEMGHEKRNEIGRNARQHALQNYSMNNMITSWDQSIEKLLDLWQNNKHPNSKRYMQEEF